MTRRSVGEDKESLPPVLVMCVSRGLEKNANVQKDVRRMIESWQGEVWAGPSRFHCPLGLTRGKGGSAQNESFENVSEIPGDGDDDDINGIDIERKNDSDIDDVLINISSSPSTEALNACTVGRCTGRDPRHRQTQGYSHCMRNTPHINTSCLHFTQLNGQRAT